MDPATIKEKVNLIASRRETLIKLLEQPKLGILKIDVNQALEELDDLIAEFKLTFPEDKSMF